MKTTFFWDKSQREFICERRATGTEGLGKNLVFAFKDPADVARLFTTNKETLIFDEHGVCWTVDSIRYEIQKRGNIIFTKIGEEG